MYPYRLARLLRAQGYKVRVRCLSPVRWASLLHWYESAAIPIAEG